MMADGIATRLTALLGLRYPIVQAGMSWASSCAALPAAVSNAGGLGVLAAGPMRPDELRAEIQALKRLTDRPWAVNVPLYRKGVEEILAILREERPPVLIASQGAPQAHIESFRAIGTRWLHVTAFPRHALKAEAAGVDAVIVVGAEAGGHPPANGVSTLVAVRKMLATVSCPVIAGGGVADGYGIAALLALGADAVQLGTRFLMTDEARLHADYKRAVLQADIDGTALVGPANLPVRIVRNDFARRALEASAAGLAESDPAAWQALLDAATLKAAALHGDVEGGKVEAGQSAGLIGDVRPAAEVFATLVAELEAAMARLRGMAGDETRGKDEMERKRANG
jgi:enoyl-[acyl-carrier protein] reductase II